jgi:hypothetical protein
VRGKLLLYVWVGFSSTSLAQIAATKSFGFLDIPNNARLAALGGVNVSLTDRDINFFSSNPSLAGDTLAGFASATYQFYVADIGNASFTYGHNFSNIGTVVFGIQHLNYGTIKGYDATGQEIGDFKSGETAFVISKSHQVSNFRLGANLKFAFSNIAGYRANALLADVGGVFIHPRQEFRVGLTIRNIGFILSEYSETSDVSLPFDVQVGLTLKPEHMPIRFSLSAYNLTGESDYFDPKDGEPEPGTLNKIMRHFNFGAEILVHKNVNLMVGYNYLVHQELKLPDAGGGAGLSFGFSAMIKTFEFVFSRSAYVVGNAGYAFTLSKNIDNMMKRRKI